ncbi:MAG: hypothetical protein AAFV19_12510 [Pseudomonadota bacterium]
MLDHTAQSSLHPDLGYLAAGRVHEATGSGRRTFALALAARLTGPILWVQDAAARDALYAPGIARFFDPARLIVALPVGRLQILQVVEEALRSGAPSLVVAELEAAPDLTASRRLQLAAGTGGGRGLILMPEHRLCTNAAETRWRCTPRAGAADTLQDWEITKNKRGRLGTWQVTWDGIGFSETPRNAGDPAHPVRGAGFHGHAAQAMDAKHSSDTTGTQVPKVSSKSGSPAINQNRSQDEGRLGGDCAAGPNTTAQAQKALPQP